jgi:hypothetical protein
VLKNLADGLRIKTSDLFDTVAYVQDREDCIYLKDKNGNWFVMMEAQEVDFLSDETTDEKIL